MSSIGNSANSLLPELTSGKDFSAPDINLNDPSFDWSLDPNDPINGPVTKLTLADLTSGDVGGSGSFDTIMTSMRAHLLDEYEKNRITGADYVKAYIELTSASLQTGATFLLEKENSFWQAAVTKAQALRAQVEAVTSKVNLQIARAQLATAKFQAFTAEVNYALGKAELAKSGIAYDDAKYRYDNILPVEKDMAVAQKNTATFQLENILPVERDTATYQLRSILPAQRDSVIEQANAARAQTLNTRFDGQVVVGSVGKQKDLYTQQITSYQRDSEVKAAKIYSDAWTVMKTIDEGLDAPTAFTNTNLDKVMTHIQSNNGLA